MAKRKRNAHVKDAPAPQPATGPDRYTVERFLCNCCERSKEYIIQNCKEYEQFIADEVPTDALPVLVILASYARQHGVDLVDDYVHLLDRYWDELEHHYHPDKFFASCIVILDETDQVPSPESFETINVPNLYDQLYPEE